MALSCIASQKPLGMPSPSWSAVSVRGVRLSRKARGTGGMGASLCRREDYCQIVLVHEVFYALTPEQQGLIRRHAALTMHGKSHGRILATLNQDATQNGHALTVLRDARRRVQILDPSILFSPDGGLRVELG